MNFEGQNGKEILEKICNKELNTKKNILECIAKTSVLKNSNATPEQIQDVYNLIYKDIEEMSSTIKANTTMHLKNELKAELGKLVSDKDPKEINHFIEFFKEAYPKKARGKGYTWVLMDSKKISAEQIWTTLTYINSWSLRPDNKLTGAQKKDIISFVELLVERNNIKYINQVKSLEKFLSNLGIRIDTVKDKFKVKNRYAK